MRTSFATRSAACTRRTGLQSSRLSSTTGLPTGRPPSLARWVRRSSCVRRIAACPRQERGTRSLAWRVHPVLDADDRLLPDAVRSGVAALAGRAEAGCVARRCLIIDSAGDPVPSTPPAPVSDDLYSGPAAHQLRVDARRRPVPAEHDHLDRRFSRGLPRCRRLCGAADARAARSAGVRGSRRRLVPEARVQHVARRDADARRGACGSRKGAPNVGERHWRAFLDGQRRWREFYGEQLTMDLRREWRTSRRLRFLLTGAFFLCRRCPRQAARHFFRKFFRVVRALPSTEIEGRAAAPAGRAGLTIAQVVRRPDACVNATYHGLVSRTWRFSAAPNEPRPSLVSQRNSISPGRWIDDRDRHACALDRPALVAAVEIPLFRVDDGDGRAEAAERRADGIGDGEVGLDDRRRVASAVAPDHRRRHAQLAASSGLNRERDVADVGRAGAEDFHVEVRGARRSVFRRAPDA